MKKIRNLISALTLVTICIFVLSGFIKNEKPVTSLESTPVTTFENKSISLICVENGSSKDANLLGKGTGKQLPIKFTGANWSGVENTCGNYVRADKNRNGKAFTFSSPNLYQYQMVLFEQGQGVRNYFTGICEEDETYTITTKKGFDYYVYTNDTSGDHEDNNGYVSFCYSFY